MRISHRLLAGALLLLLITSGMAYGKSRKRKRAAAPAQFSYYLLVLSYAPDFCAQPQGTKNFQECGAGRRVGFVVHGLWPQGDTTRGPQNCAPASPVSQSIVQATLNYIPTASLIQHEWTTHGTCSGLSAADYFAALRKARDSVQIPQALSQPSQQLQLSSGQVESQMSAANPSYPATAFRTACYPDRELEDVRVCLNKDLSPRPCTPSAGECGAGTVTMLPVH